MADLILRYQSQYKAREKPQKEQTSLEKEKSSQMVEVCVPIKKIVDIFSKVIFTEKVS